MKFFRKKGRSPAKPHPRAVEPDSSDFYAQHNDEVLLAGPSRNETQRPTYRTSRHSPARVRENSNQAGRWQVFLLLLRAGLIVALLVGGLVLLKLVLDRRAEQSEKQQQQAGAAAASLEKQAVDSTISVDASAQPLAVSSELIGQRLEQWEQTERNFRSAEALVRRGLDDEAIQRLGQLLLAAPSNRKAQQQLLELYMKKGLFAEAVPLCIRLLDQDSQQKEIQMTLLSALQSSGQAAAALLLADRLLQDRPHHLPLLTLAATGRLELGNLEAALALFERMLEVDAKNKGALEGCGRIYEDRGDYSKAASYYLELVRVAPNPGGYQALARCYARQNEPGKAVTVIGQAASLFGEPAVAPWLRDTVFDPIRESADFRAFADRLVGVETRKAIEAINKRAPEKPVLPDVPLERPKQLDLKTVPDKK